MSMQHRYPATERAEVHHGWQPPVTRLHGVYSFARLSCARANSMRAAEKSPTGRFHCQSATVPLAPLAVAPGKMYFRNYLLAVRI